jgi:hypothetical protein
LNKERDLPTLGGAQTNPSKGGLFRWILAPSSIVSVFCIIDDRIEELGRLRARGTLPKLSDAEVLTVLTIEVVGEFLGLDPDEAIFRYFREHYGE